MTLAFNIFVVRDTIFQVVTSNSHTAVTVELISTRISF